MARGFLSGVVVGGVVSVLGAGVASVLSDPPQAPSASVESPEAVAAPVPGDGADAKAVTDADLVLDGTAPQVTSPDADDVTAAAEAGSDTALVPQTGAADDLNDPAAAADSAAVSVDGEAPVLPSPQGALVAAPDTEGQLSISTDPAQPPAPDVPEAATAFAPEADEAPEAPSAEAPAPETAPVTAPDAPQTAEAPDTPASPEAPVEPEAPTETEPVETETAALPEDTSEDSGGRPTIGRPATSLVDRTPDAPTVPEEPDAAPDGPPIDRFAAPFENPEDKPVMSIVLMDTGVDLTGGPVGLAALKSFPYPLTFAVDARLDDAAERASEFRAQGFEVMVLMDLPSGATGSDTEVNLTAAIDAVPEAVAVMEGVGTGLQESRDASDQEGGVIMVGRVRPDTISALLLWGLQDRAQRVALAPVSHVLKALAEVEQ